MIAFSITKREKWCIPWILVLIFFDREAIVQWRNMKSHSVWLFFKTIYNKNKQKRGINTPVTMYYDIDTPN